MKKKEREREDEKMGTKMGTEGTLAHKTNQ